VTAVRLYLVQHGEAKSEAEDPDRPLTDGGAAQVREVANGAAAGGLVKVGRILHSGKTRARQTAEAWGEALGVNVEAAKGLAPNDDPSIWAEGLGDEDLMLVGHLPHLANLAQALLGGDGADQPVIFRNGELVALERTVPGRWAVVISPPPADYT
jgi:phosphohistidine phosphatase